MGAWESSVPPARRLRAYAFDPSLSTELDTAMVNVVTVAVPWEEDLEPGPVGEYLEVVDYDPASHCYYEPVDLDRPHVLAQDGLVPSEGNPQFHQQMTYAVAMATIKNFERALGRPAFFAPHRRKGEDGKERFDFVRRLRIYPHALRAANAYYSPDKKALLFGYFPAVESNVKIGDRVQHFPGGWVFTCLSHDVVAHETTHALLDGMHRRFIESTHPDSLAFHEAFADIVALFQHFSYAEVLEAQIAKTRGDLAGSESMLGKMALQFGQATGQHGALRDAIGTLDPKTNAWVPRIPDPTALETTFEPHARGAILVAAVFDAFLAIYRMRTTDLFRIATRGTGVLPQGDIHPDLVKRLAKEASSAARNVCHICIRALDYCPPVDIHFGDYLRAIVTADSDLVPDDRIGYRIAFIEAFRRRGIYPRSVRTLSVESLRWPFAFRGRSPEDVEELGKSLKEHLSGLLQYAGSRADYAEQSNEAARRVHQGIKDHFAGPASPLAGFIALEKGSKLEGLALGDDGVPTFEIHSVRPAERVGPSGERVDQAVVVVTQKRTVPADPKSGAPEHFEFRGGATLIFELATGELVYVIGKSILDEHRLAAQRAFIATGRLSDPSNTYAAPSVGRRLAEPFALLHRPADEESP